MTALITQPIVSGTAYVLQVASAADANAITLDNTTAETTATLTQNDGIGSATFTARAVPYVAGGQWKYTIPGQNFVAGSLPYRLEGDVLTADGALTRLAQQYRLPLALPTAATCPPGVSLLVTVASFVVGGASQTNLNASGTVTVTDAGGNGTVQVNGAALVYDNTAGAWQYAIAGSVVVAGGQYLVVAQMTDLGGNQTLSKRWLVTVDW